MAAFPLGPAYIKRTLRYNGVRKGLLGGSRFWLVVFLGSQLARWSSKVTKRGEMPIRFSERLGPGEAFEIRHIDPNRSSAR